MYGMKNANDLLTRQGGEDNDNGIFKVINNNNVMNDLIEQNVTKEVEELREKHYRIVKEADKYDTSTIKISFDADGNPIYRTVSSTSGGENPAGIYETYWSAAGPISEERIG